MKHGIYPMDFDSAKIYSRVKRDEFEKLVLKLYKDDTIEDGYLIEALIYPSDELYKVMGGERGDTTTDIAVYLRLQDLVKRKNRFCKKQEKISRVVLLDKPV